MSAIAGKVGAVYQNYSGTDKSKLIADFQSDETWVADSSELVTNDTTNFRLGNKSIKLQDNDDTSNITSMILGSITLDIAQFESGASSDTNDYIYMIFYVNLSTYFNNVGLDFSTGSFDPNNRYTYNVTTLVDGWNYVKVKKSLFATTGSPSWSGIQSIRAKASTKVGANSAGAYVSFQSLYLIDDSYDFALANNTAYTLEQICLFYNWDLDIESDIEEITTFCSDGWKTFLPTLNGFTVTPAFPTTSGREELLETIGIVPQLRLSAAGIPKPS